MDKNASSADDPRDGVIDVERLEESWWPPAAHSFPTPKGLNGADWRALRTAGELGPGEPVADGSATTVAEALVAEGDEPRRPRRIGWVAAVVPIVVVGGIVGLAIGGGSDDASRSAVGGVPTSTEVTSATSTSSATTTAPVTTSPATTGATTAATAAPTTAATTATTVAPTTAPTTSAVTTAPPSTTATTAARPPVTLASPGDAQALDDIDIAGLNWWGELRDRTIFLRGRIPTVAARDLVIANAKARAGEVRVVEQLVVDPSITAARPLGDVPLFFTERVYFTGASTTIDSDYTDVVRFARFTLDYQQGVSLAVVVRTPDDTEGTALARDRADVVAEAVVAEGIDRSRVVVSTTQGMGDAASTEELTRRDAAALLVFYGFFTAPPGT